MYLPVFHPGALFYFGDGHALQGDGEIAGHTCDVAGTVTTLAALDLGLERYDPERIHDVAWVIFDEVHHLPSGSYRKIAAQSPERRQRIYYATLYLFWAILLAVPLVGNLGAAWLLVEATTAASALLVGFSGHARALEAGWKYLVLTSLGLGVALLERVSGRDLGLSSAHVDFHGADEAAAFDAEWLARTDIQYHWRNRDGWADFDGFLGAMDHRHRKNIRQERAKVARAGITFRVVHGDEADERDLAAVHGYYLRTFAEYGNTPALTPGFLAHLAREMPRQLVLVLAMRGDVHVAGALCLRGGDTLYGRYWGADEAVPGLHFETCYYQGIEYCLREGLSRFEPGAQGEHKLARGFLPTLVHSRHWIAEPAFATALRSWCAQETAAVREHAAILGERGPFRAGTAPT